MSLGTGAIKSWWGPREKTRHSVEVPWQPCEREPALQAANNQNRHTEGTSAKKLTWPNNYMNQFLRGAGRAGRWTDKIGDQTGYLQSWTEQTNCRSCWPKQWFVQGSDLQRSVGQTIAIMATGYRAHMQAHGKENPCGHPTDHTDR